MSTTTAAPSLNETMDLPSWLSASINTFSKHYQAFHCYFALVVCIFGNTLGALNVVCLNTAKLRSEVNFMLSMLALSDMVTDTIYLFYVVVVQFVHPTSLFYGFPSLGVAYFLRVYTFVVSFSHACSIWLVVSIAAFRYRQLLLPLSSVANTSSGHGSHNMPPVYLLCVLVVIWSLLTGIPSLLIMRIETIPPNSEMNETRYKFQGAYQYPLLVQAVFVKLIPALALTLLCYGIITQLKLFIENRRRIGKDFSQCQHTTRMLIAIVLLFIFLETPQGIFLGISSLSHVFFIHIYNPLGDVVDAMTLSRTIATFIIYCTMNKQYRDYVGHLWHRTTASAMTTSGRRRFFRRTGKTEDDTLQATAQCQASTAMTLVKTQLNVKMSELELQQQQNQEQQVMLNTTNRNSPSLASHW